MRRLTPLIALALAVGLATGADAYTIKGRGSGHGVGMSQWGAYGYARHGVGYRDILRHYYSHTKVEDAGGRKIRVLLEDGESTVPLAGVSDAGGHGMNADITYRARPRGSRIVFYGPDGKRAFSTSSPVLVSSDYHTFRLGGTAINGVTDGAYRGGVELRLSSSGGLAAINVLSVDSYVKGVVPGEVPASWPADALKAQAVAARSYALTTHAGGDVFDQYPDTRSQVYRGMDGEQPRSSGAVKATAHEVVKYHGDIATTYFFSTSGGRTENVENSFGGDPVPYLKSVKDPYDYYSPLHKWTIRYPKSEVAARLSGLVRGRFRGIRVVKRGASPRIVLADVVGSKGKLRVSGTTLRSRLDLHDTWASFPSFGTKRDKALAALPVPLLAPVAPEYTAPR